jgi:hypothetical protein
MNRVGRRTQFVLHRRNDARRRLSSGLFVCLFVLLLLLLFWYCCCLFVPCHLVIDQFSLCDCIFLLAHNNMPTAHTQYSVVRRLHTRLSLLDSLDASTAAAAHWPSSQFPGLAFIFGVRFRFVSSEMLFLFVFLFTLVAVRFGSLSISMSITRVAAVTSAVSHVEFLCLC